MRLPVILLALVLVGARHRSHHGARRSEKPPVAAETVAIPVQNRDALLFPGLLSGPAQTGAHQRCFPFDASGTAPGWLRDAIATPVCTDSLRSMANSVPGRDGAAPSLQDLLTAAALCDDGPAIRRLAADGADVTRRDSCGSVALGAAAAAGAALATAELLAIGADPSLASEQGLWSRAPLLDALIRRDDAIANLILKAGADVDATTPQNRSALMFAAAMNDQELVRRILQNNTTVCQRDAFGLSALDVAQAFGAFRVVPLLKGRTAKCGAPRRLG